MSNALLMKHFDNRLLPHMKQQAASVGSKIGRSLDEITFEPLGQYCNDNEFARRWVEECSPRPKDMNLTIGTGCDPLRIEDMEWHHQNDEQGQDMFKLNLMYIGIAGDGETFVVSMDTGRVYLMQHQWTLDEYEFEDCISQQWDDIPSFLDTLIAENL